MSTLATAPARFASPADVVRYGTYSSPQRADDPRPLYRFTGRLTEGAGPFPAEPGRYHLYASWTCPWSQRVVLERQVNGLDTAFSGGEGGRPRSNGAVIGLSYVDDARDGRGWAFREADGPDPVNGFAFLSEAYEATTPGYDGVVNVPVLWDTVTRRIVSNDYASIGLDLATRFAGVRPPGVDTYPVGHRAEIEELDRWVGPAVNRGLTRARADGPAGAQARAELQAAFRRLDNRLVDGGFLVGHGLTEADLRLWVSLARYDVSANADGRLGPPLSTYPHLARYAAWLADLPAFRATTRWSSFTAPGASPSFAHDISRGTGTP